MSYKPFAMPEELHAWLKARAEKLSAERGAPVSMNDVLREARDVVEAVELAAVRQPVTPAIRQPVQR